MLAHLIRHFPFLQQLMPVAPAGHHRLLGPAVYVLIPLSIVVEILWYLLVQKRRYPWSEMFTSVGVYTLRAPLKLLRVLVVAPLIYLVWSHRMNTLALNSPLVLLLLFLGVEFAYYWMHRLSHIRYGLVHPLGTLNPLVVTFHEWIAMARGFFRASTWRQRLTQLFGRPADRLI